MAGELFLAEENYVEAAKCFEIRRLLFSKGIWRRGKNKYLSSRGLPRGILGQVNMSEFQQLYLRDDVWCQECWGDIPKFTFWREKASRNTHTPPFPEPTVSTLISRFQFSFPPESVNQGVLDACRKKLNVIWIWESHCWQLIGSAQERMWCLRWKRPNGGSGHDIILDWLRNGWRSPTPKIECLGRGFSEDGI